MPRFLITLSALSVLSGCYWAPLDDSARDMAEFRARSLQTWGEMGRKAGEYMRNHPGQPLPDYLGPPPPMGATTCQTLFVPGGSSTYPELTTDCDNY